MNTILFDDPELRAELLPLTLTRPVGAIRIGIFTIAEKWERWLGRQVSFSTQSYLSKKFPLKEGADNLWINASVCPNQELVDLIGKLKSGDGIRQGTRLLAARTGDSGFHQAVRNSVEVAGEVVLIDRLWKIFLNNGQQIRADFDLIRKKGTSAGIADKATVVYRGEDVFVEEGVTVKAAIINAEPGPVYIGRNAQVQEGAIIRGPFCLGENSIINMGGKMRGDTTIGPDCKVGGEISNSILFGNSNKSHDGFLGNSVLGEWCNLGADTNTSNMKNNYDVVRLWNYPRQNHVSTGLYFCGLIMGDHSKSGINTMFNTGSVVGVSANVIGGGYPPTFVPSFSWAQDTTYTLDKALETADRAMKRRHQELSTADREILGTVFGLTAQERKWEHKK